MKSAIPSQATPPGAVAGELPSKLDPVWANRPESEWRRGLTDEQYRVLRQKATERPFTGKYWNHHDRGFYRCAACGLVLFDSECKFDSGTGWPSFYKATRMDAVAEEPDDSLLSSRIEVHCSRCGGHLGHLFKDGPPPTGLRYCVNSASLVFESSK
ncbi:MAG: peptide-methionine (R)-S-oxide reductase MsrB [Candidatus Riflebacteria bacterium]|nr:peptide-methionine (R)-S-oxide reductase MsrB [Candidatus Riflebacteria bacterium]